jgi:alpha-beta hydrolase superfamily lysophospholipase
MRLLSALLAVALLAGAAWLVAPRMTWPLAAQIEARVPGENLDAWLAAREGVFDDITEGTQKVIRWAGEAGTRTPLAVIYLHGFSATRQEISPVPELVAEGLGANLFLTRLAGHGRGGAALGAASVDDWASDLAEAMAIGARLGERVVLMGTSTGGSIAVLAALDPGYEAQVAAVVALAPNFALMSPQAWMLDLPWAARWLPSVMGAERSWEAPDEASARYWTTPLPHLSHLSDARRAERRRRRQPRRRAGSAFGVLCRRG